MTSEIAYSNSTISFITTTYIYIYIYIYIYRERERDIKRDLPTPPLGQDMIQGQFLSGV